MKSHALIALLLLTALAPALMAQESDGTDSTNSPKPAAGRHRPPTLADLSYGPHARQVMDIWLAPSATPTPVLFSIHGGGFVSGNKSVPARLLEECLNNKISVVAISYRYSSQAIAPAPFHDGARAVQFVRARAKEWNIDPERIAATGGSAGAGICLFLALHDDLADPGNPDPVLRQSTRLRGVVAVNGQTTYDPRVIKTLFPEQPVYRHAVTWGLFGLDVEHLDSIPAEKIALVNDVCALTLVSKDDPPVLLTYGSTLETPVTSVSVGIHHPRFGKLLQEKMQEAGVDCTLLTGPGNGGATMDFLKKHLLR